MKHFSCRALFVFALVLAFAPVSLAAAESAFFCGLGLEAHGNSRAGAAFGGGLALGYEFTPSIAAGIKALFGSTFEGFSTLEPLAFFRLSLPINKGALFAQAEAGASIFFEDGDSRQSANGGLLLGWRFAPGASSHSGEGRNPPHAILWYIEPSVRVGYPYIWGAGITAGLRFAAKKGEQ
jgi:hypothetical protein